MRVKLFAVTGMAVFWLFAGAPAGPAAGAERIVAAGAGVTEILWDLGLAPDIVGVDTTSRNPPEALKTKPDIGYFRRLSAEGLLALDPTLVVAAQGAGPRETLDLVRAAGVRVETIDDPFTVAGTLAKIERLGVIAGRPAEAAALVRSTREGFTALETARGRLDSHPRVLFLLGLTNGRPSVAGRGTAADAMIALAGGVNVGAGFEGYKPLTDEAVIDAAPDVVVVMDGGPERLDADRVFALPAFAGTPAARDRRFIAMDGADLVAFGPRTPAIARRLMDRIRGR